MQEIFIYTSPGNSTNVEVRLENDTLWLDQRQMAELFDRDYKSIAKHINNILKDGELTEESTVAKIATVRNEGNRLVNRDIEHYNLDMIISVGYRVNSKRGTQFRQWATQRLKDYLVQGYSINDKKLKDQSERIQSLHDAVVLMSKTAGSIKIETKELQGILDLLQNYTRGLQTLENYDSGASTETPHSLPTKHFIETEEAIHVIQELRKSLKASSQFGEDTGEQLPQLFRTINQIGRTTGSVEHCAANLLYSIIKSHPFVDGNKRIGAFLFVYFLEKNNLRIDSRGEQKINANGLAALALLVSQSSEEEKENMLRLIINLIK